MKTLRKTSYLAYQKHKVPFIRLSGKWLEDLGFKVHSTFTLIVEDNSIQLSPVRREGGANE